MCEFTCKPSISVKRSAQVCMLCGTHLLLTCGYLWESIYHKRMMPDPWWVNWLDLSSCGSSLNVQALASYTHRIVYKEFPVATKMEPPCYTCLLAWLPHGNYFNLCSELTQSPWGIITVLSHDYKHSIYGVTMVMTKGQLLLFTARGSYLDQAIKDNSRFLILVTNASMGNTDYSFWSSWLLQRTKTLPHLLSSS